MFDREKIAALIECDAEVSVYDELTSTNLKAKELAYSGDRREKIIIAKSQTGGMGRLGRTFHSPSGGLYMSLLLYPQMDASDTLLITTTAALAVARAIDAIAGIRAQIKWVNDIYLRGKKVCGILTQSQISGEGTLDFAVLGIGINIFEPKGGFPSEIAERAGAIFKSGDPNIGNMLAATVVNEFHRLFKAPRLCIDEYRSRSNLIGREVDVFTIADGGSTPATVIGINDDFSLLVRYQDGEIVSLSSGEVSIREHK